MFWGCLGHGGGGKGGAGGRWGGGCMGETRGRCRFLNGDIRNLLSKILTKLGFFWQQIGITQPQTRNHPKEREGWYGVVPSNEERYSFSTAINVIPQCVPHSNMSYQSQRYVILRFISKMVSKNRTLRKFSLEFMCNVLPRTRQWQTAFAFAGRNQIDISNPQTRKVMS